MTSVDVLELECSNIMITKSKIPLVDLITATCNNKVELAFDIHRELNIFKNTKEIKLEILKEKPDCNPSTDYCGQGYVFSIANADGKTRVLISIGGYIIRLLGNIKHNFKPMDKVYVRIRSIS